jgi:hypothetical protein
MMHAMMPAVLRRAGNAHPAEREAALMAALPRPGGARAGAQPAMGERLAGVDAAA